MVSQGGEIKHVKLSGTLYSAIKSKANDEDFWKLGTNLAERRSTEAAVQILETEGYEILYVQRSKALYEDAAGTEHFLHKGPDIVARNPQTGNTVIVEVKGTEVAGTTNFTNSRFSKEFTDPNTGTVLDVVQPDRLWLTTDPDRYMLPLESAIPTNPNLSRAVEGLDDIISGGDYEAILIGFSTNTADFGLLDDVFDQLTTDALRVHTYVINP